VFASSIKAVGEHSTEPWTESVVPAPADAYGRTKLEAEQLIADRAATAGLHAPILRLPLVYGAGMKANMLRLFDTVDRDIPLPFGAVRNRRSLLYAGNMVAALLGTLESSAGSGTFFVSDDDDMSTPELVCAIAEALGRRARLLRVPVAILRAGGRAGDVLGRLGRFPLTSSALDRVVGSLAVDCSRLKRLTGYGPPFRARDGLRLTADWYHHTRRTTQ
jgi:UDP-glucose 4-epimerase